MKHALIAAVFASVACGQDRPGYTDTPQLPNSKWRVHDSARPYPAVVTPGEAAAPPSDAVVLFDGKDLSKWKGDWKVENGYVEVARGKGDLTSKDEFGDCQLHVEWNVPQAKGQGGGNSGVFLMGRYEVQVLDSFENATYADGQAAAIYGQYPPLVNASRKPREWQSYDIVFVAPRWKDGKLESPARMTVIHNGVVVHHAAEVIGQTAHRAVAKYVEHGPSGPIRIQDHGDPVRYRNIWVRALKAYD
jgi:hypothetical protein